MIKTNRTVRKGWCRRTSHLRQHHLLTVKVCAWKWRGLLLRLREPDDVGELCQLRAFFSACSSCLRIQPDASCHHGGPFLLCRLHYLTMSPRRPYSYRENSSSDNHPLCGCHRRSCIKGVPPKNYISARSCLRHLRFQIAVHRIKFAFAI
jgi:hypothetical protein